MDCSICRCVQRTYLTIAIVNWLTVLSSHCVAVTIWVHKPGFLTICNLNKRVHCLGKYILVYNSRSSLKLIHHKTQHRCVERNLSLWKWQNIFLLETSRKVTNFSFTVSCDSIQSIPTCLKCLCLCNWER